MIKELTCFNLSLKKLFGHLVWAPIPVHSNGSKIRLGTALIGQWKDSKGKGKERKACKGKAAQYKLFRIGN